jgi:hypothetical protein
MNIKLPILFNNDSTLHLEAVGVDSKLSDYDIREFTFYSISGIAPYTEFGRDYTVVYSGGFDYICPKPKEEVEQLIHENKLRFYAN